MIGVAPAGFFGVAAGLEPEFFVPIHGRHPASAFESTTSSWLHLMGRLKDGITREQADAALQATWPSIMEVDHRHQHAAGSAGDVSGPQDSARIRPHGILAGA